MGNLSFSQVQNFPVNIKSGSKMWKCDTPPTLKTQYLVGICRLATFIRFTYVDALKSGFSDANNPAKTDETKRGDEHTVNPLIHAVIIREYSDHQRPRPVKMARYYLAAHERAGRLSDLMTPSRWLPIPLLLQNFECGNEAPSHEGTFKEKKKKKHQKLTNQIVWLVSSVH